MFLPATADMVFEDEGALSRSIITPVDGVSKYMSGMLDSVVAKDCSRYSLTDYPKHVPDSVTGGTRSAYTNKSPSSETWTVSQRLDTPLLWARKVGVGSTVSVAGPSGVLFGRTPTTESLAHRNYASGLKSVSARWKTSPELSGLPDLETASMPYATSIPVGVFKNCANLASVKLRGVTATESAFEGCAKLGSYPDVEGLAKNLFKGCSTLAFPALDLSDLSVIPEGCFDGCAKLSNVVLYKGHIGSGGTYDLAPGTGFKSDKPRIAGGTIGPRAFAGTGLASLVIPCDITGWGKTSWSPSIASTAFTGCTKLLDVRFHIGAVAAADNYWVNTSGRFLPGAMWLRGTHQSNNYNDVMSDLPIISAGVESTMFGLPDKCTCKAGRYDAQQPGTVDYNDLVATVETIKGVST